MPTDGSYVTDVKVSGFKKVNRNYLYIIQTTWSDGMKFEIYRRYGDFFSFQDTLLKLFPTEAGKYDSVDRKIPFLPTVDNVFKLFGRTNSESVMQARLETINYYCQTILLRVGDHISRCSHVINFFFPTPNDKQLRRLGKPLTLHPLRIPSGNHWEEYILLADFAAEAGKTQQLSAKAGEEVTVLKNDESGWSLCSKNGNNKVAGWIPTSFLKKKVEEIELGYIISETLPDDALQSTDTIEESFLKYRAICEYEVNDPSQVGFPEGAILTVIDQDEDGWWFVNYKGKEGWAPSSYLEPENGTGIITEEELDEVCIQTQEGATPMSLTEIFYTKREYKADLEDELSFPKGAKVEVLNKSISGWWTAKYNDEIGVVPATFLTKEPLQEEKSQTSNELTVSAPQSPLLTVSEAAPIFSTERISGGSKFNRPPPRRMTVRHTIMMKKQRLLEQS